MRIRAAVAVALVVLPSVVGAQRVRIGSRSPGRAELPPQAPVVAQQMRYVRLPVSMETYQLVSYFDSPGMTAGSPITTWMSLGLGTRVDYRIVRNLSATFDMTSSLLGGPALTQTAELGLRLRRDRGEARFYPFADLRYGYLFAANSQARMLDFAPGSDAQTFGFAGGYSDGFGAVGGLGMEVALGRQLSLTTAATALRMNVTAHDFNSANPSAVPHFPVSAYRYTLGLRWNPVRYLGATAGGRGSR